MRPLLHTGRNQSLSSTGRLLQDALTKGRLLSLFACAASRNDAAAPVNGCCPVIRGRVVRITTHLGEEGNFEVMGAAEAAPDVKADPEA